MGRCHDLKARGIEEALKAYYRAERQVAPPAEKASLVTFLASRVEEGGEDAAPEKARRVSSGLGRFVGSQVSFVGARVWIAQLAILSAMVVTCLIDPSSAAVTAAASVLPIASPAVGFPCLVSSHLYGVDEIEQSCRFDAFDVALARALILGVSSVLVVTAIVLVAPLLAGADPVRILLHATIPYFAVCGGCLLIARRVTRGNCIAAGFAWISLVTAGAACACTVTSTAYDVLSLTAWSAIAAAGALWTLAEAVCWLRSVSRASITNSRYRTIVEA